MFEKYRRRKEAEELRALELRNLALSVLGVEAMPDSGMAWYDLAESLNSLGVTEHAIDCYRKAIGRGLSKHEGLLPEAWYSKARLEDGLGRNSDAIASYKEALKASKGRPGIVTQDANKIAARIEALGGRKQEADLRLKEIAQGGDLRCARCGKRVKHDIGTMVFHEGFNIEKYFSDQALKCSRCGTITCGECGAGRRVCSRCGGETTLDW